MGKSTVPTQYVLIVIFHNRKTMENAHEDQIKGKKGKKSPLNFILGWCWVQTFQGFDRLYSDSVSASRYCKTGCVMPCQLDI